MAMTTAERMARLRARQRSVGLSSLTVVVPTEDVDAFVRLATRRRTLKEQHGPDARRPVRLHKRKAAATGTSISPADILAFRMLLETTAVALCIRRLNAAAVRRLRGQLDREAALGSDADSSEFQRLHMLLGELSGDEPLQLLLRIALQLTDDRSAFGRAHGQDRARAVGTVKRLHAGIVDAVVDRNEALAVWRVRRYLSGLREWLV